MSIIDSLLPSTPLRIDPIIITKYQLQLEISRIEIALMLFLNECTKPARACLPIHSISIHTTHMQYTECFHVDLSVYNVFIVHPKEQCGNVNQAKPGGQATQMYHYNAEDQDRNV